MEGRPELQIHTWQGIMLVYTGLVFMKGCLHSFGWFPSAGKRDWIGLTSSSTRELTAVAKSALASSGSCLKHKKGGACAPE
jgi:hypothetical protein